MKKTIMAAAIATSIASTGAHAAVINLIDVGGVTGSAAEKGFQVAADYWGSILTNDANINLEVKFDALGKGIIGSTGSNRQDFLVYDWINAINATKSSSSIDQTAVLPTMDTSGYFIEGAKTSGVDANGNNDNSEASLDGKYAGAVLYQNTAVQKAIGFDDNLAGVVDGSMTFSSTFAFDFDPTDGIDANTFDFLGVAIHEMGHALGFVSGVDLLDFYGGPNGPGYGTIPGGYDLNNTSLFTALDMFRYSAPGQLDFRPGVTSYFSIDGGQTALMDGLFSTGNYNGDSAQASHWKEEPFCGAGLGIMDPTFCFGQMGEISGLDLAAYDAMGWNLNVDALTYGSETSAEIYARLTQEVSEPAMLALMFGTLGFMGFKRRKKA